MERAKILIVDDEAAFTRNLSRLLAVRGYHVTEANDGESALRAFGEAWFDVVVLDLKMPGMNGIGTLEKIKELGLFTQTLILTGHGTADTRVAAERLGAAAYLEKPCDLGTLLEAIDRALKKKNITEKRDALNRMIRA